MGLTGGILTDILIGAGVGAGATAGVDALTGQPITLKGEAIGAGLGAVGGGAAGAFSGGAGAGAAGAGDAAFAGDAALADAGATAAGADLATAAPAAFGGDAALSAAGAGSADAALAGSVLPEVTVSASALPAAAGAGAGVAGGAAGLAGSAALSGGGNAVGDIGNSSIGGGTSFLPATSASDLTPLSSDVAGSLGIDTGGGTAPGTQIPGFGMFSEDPGMLQAMDSSGGLGGDSSGGILDWFKNPKHLATAGLLGMSGLNALKQPKLPSASQTAVNAAGPAVGEATNIIKSGGTNTPLWAQQKSSIDASINQQIQQQTESLLQTAASQGMGDKNSPVVQQMLAQMTQNLNAQKQSLYLQAQQQNVNNAIAELTGSNAVLTSVGEMQLAQSQEARQAAAQTAELALLLQSLG